MYSAGDIIHFNSRNTRMNVMRRTSIYVNLTCKAQLSHSLHLSDEMYLI